MSCLYILEIDLLLIPSLAKIFSHSESSLFIMFMVSFTLQKLLIISHLFIFFYFHYSKGWVKKRSCCNLCQIFLCQHFPLKSLVSGLTFRSLISIIFVYGVRECFDFIILRVATQLFQNHLLKRLSALHCSLASFAMA